MSKLPGSTAERELFIAGCPRSGTSALVFLLNEHPELALGFERFKRVRAQLDPFHFTASQFFAPVAVETDIPGELLYARLHGRWMRGTVKLIGDKVPLYTRVLPQILERFPGGRVVVMVRELRDVAVSFQRRAADPEDWWPAENDHRLAVQMWNEALAAVREAERRGEGERVFLLPYEPLLAGEERWLRALLGFLGVRSTERLEIEHRRLAAAWNDKGGTHSQVRGAESGAGESELDTYLEAYSDGELHAWAHARMESQIAHSTSPPSGGQASDGESTPLTASELQERAVEQRQLLEQMRLPGEHGPDELELLERRLLEGGQELVRRQTRARMAPLRTRGRVTFVAPHRRATTGGVYVIEQYARHLAAMGLQVTLAVRGSEDISRPLPGVAVRAVAQLGPQALPQGDVVVYPADMRDAGTLYELPDAVGRPVMFFQGYGTPGSAIVEANLQSARASVAIAHWLVGVALARGVPCAYVPQGLDRTIFYPGPATQQRPPRVSLMTHRLDWKGLEDALTAIALVRRTRPEVEVMSFGTEPVEGADTFLQSPTRPQVAGLLRTSAVHLVSSWEEGFGLTGAEAIACGAALASTDTKGSRDYALDGSTALVSAPRDPEALARNVLRLLDDIELRRRLVETGQRQLHTVMPLWSEAARRMALVLLED